MNPAKTRRLALENGFKLKPQAGGRPDDLHDYVYAFASAVERVTKEDSEAALKAALLTIQEECARAARHCRDAEVGSPQASYWSGVHAGCVTAANMIGNIIGEQHVVQQNG